MPPQKPRIPRRPRLRYGLSFPATLRRGAAVHCRAGAWGPNTEHAGAAVRYHFHRGTLPAPVRYTRSLEFLPAPPLHVLRVAGASELLCPVPLPCLDSGNKVNRYTVSLLFQVYLPASALFFFPNG